MSRGWMESITSNTSSSCVLLPAVVTAAAAAAALSRRGISSAVVGASKSASKEILNPRTAWTCLIILTAKGRAKKIVVPSNPVNLQEFHPDTRQGRFDHSLRRLERLTSNDGEPRCPGEEADAGQVCHWASMGNHPFAQSSGDHVGGEFCRDMSVRCTSNHIGYQ